MRALILAAGRILDRRLSPTAQPDGLIVESQGEHGISEIAVEGYGDAGA